MADREALTRGSYPELDDEALDHFRTLAQHRATGAPVVLYPSDCPSCARIVAWANVLGVDLDERRSEEGSSDG